MWPSRRRWVIDHRVGEGSRARDIKQLLPGATGDRLLAALELLREERVDHFPGLLRLLAVGLLAQERVTDAGIDVDRTARLPPLLERHVERPRLVRADAAVVRAVDPEERPLERLDRGLRGVRRAVAHDRRVERSLAERRQ